MDRCPGCNVAGLPWCWLRSIGRCAWLAEPHWAAHNAARSASPPPDDAPGFAGADDPDPFVAAWLARVRAKMRPCGCPPPAPGA